MNREEMRRATEDELEARRAELANEIDAKGADLPAIRSEVEGINAELEARRNTAAQAAQIRDMIAAQGGGTDVVRQTRAGGTQEEVRASHAYNMAYAEYIKTKNDKECRALLTETVSGTVPVPTYVEDRVRTNWDKLGIMRRVKRTNAQGILRVGFEISATDAANHTEGTSAPAEETLTLGVVSLTPGMIIKWIRISREAMSLKGEEFLNYVYDELTYKIAKKAQSNLIAAIVALTASATSTAPGVGIVTGSASVGVIAEAIGKLGDEAANPIVVMNKGSWALFKAAQYAGNFNVDPFEGLDVEFDNNLPVYASTITGSTWAIVGDFGFGAQANFPDGEEINLTVDGLTYAESALVKFVGSEYAAVGVVADKAFTKIIG